VRAIDAALSGANWIRKWRNSCRRVKLKDALNELDMELDDSALQMPAEAFSLRA